MEWTLFRRRGDDRWHLEWFVGLQRHEACLDTADEHEAEQRAAARFAAAADAAAAADQAADPTAVYCVSHSLEDFLSRGCSDNAEATRGCYARLAGHVLRLLGSAPLASLHVDQVQSYVDARLVEGAARETVRKELCVLRRALDLAHRRGQPGPLPAEVMPRFRTRYVPRKVWLSPEQLAEVVRKLARPRRLWVMVAAYTGARLSELEGLDWTDLDLPASQVHIRGRKTLQSDRLVPLHPRLAEVLREQMRVRGPVLEPWPNVRRDLAVACKHAGVQRITPNDLRRTFASWLVQAGETSHVVAQLLGHSSSHMVERVYGRLSPKTLRDAVSKLK